MDKVAEIEHAIEQLAPEQRLEIRLWMDRLASQQLCAVSEPTSLPDFLARQKAIFGGRVLEDSQAVLNELRADHK